MSAQTIIVKSNCLLYNKSVCIYFSSLLQSNKNIFEERKTYLKGWVGWVDESGWVKHICQHNHELTFTHLFCSGCQTPLTASYLVHEPEAISEQPRFHTQTWLQGSFPRNLWFLPESPTCVLRKLCTGTSEFFLREYCIFCLWILWLFICFSSRMSAGTPCTQWSCTLVMQCLGTILLTSATGRTSAGTMQMIATYSRYIGSKK